MMTRSRLSSFTPAVARFVRSVEDFGLDSSSFFRRLVHLRLAGRLVEGLEAGGQLFVLQIIELALAVLDRIDQVPGIAVVKGVSLRDRPADQSRR
jgi:hypothetical protein